MDSSTFTGQDIEFHKHTAKVYDETVTSVFRIYHSYSLHPFLDRLGIDKRSAKVLDLGCGTGVATLALATRGIKTFGIDHSPEMLEIARKKAEVMGVQSTIHLLTGDVRQLAFRDEEFDGVICQGLLHHLQDMFPCLCELSRVLKRGGFFYISEPCRERTALSRVVRKAGRAVRLLSKRRGPSVHSGEAPISSTALFKMLDSLGLTYRAEYLTHLPIPAGYLPDSIRLFIARVVSLPWSKTHGDIIFVFGQRP